MEDLVKYDKVIDQGMLYSFVPYDTPRLALYKHSTDEYKLSEGWLTKPKWYWLLVKQKIHLLQSSDSGGIIS